MYNPVSGTEALDARKARLEKLVQDAGLTCDLRETEESSGAAALARRAVEDGMERLIVCGGDGSVTEAAEALAGTETALAVLPGGTGNLLALNLAIPADGETAMRLALTGEARPLDIGRANGKVFLIMAGVGADARMVRDADREAKRRLGVLAYVIAAWRHFRRPLIPCRITIDGRTISRRAQSVLVANMGRITGGLELVPAAEPHDGLLDVAILRTRTPWDFAVLAWRALLGQRKSDPLLETHCGAHVIVELQRPQPMQLDGNDAGTTSRLEASIEPGGLLLVRPSEADLATVPIPVRLAHSAGIRAVTWGCAAAAAACGAMWLRRRGRGGPANPVAAYGVPAAAGLLSALLAWFLPAGSDEAPEREQDG